MYPLVSTRENFAMPKLNKSVPRYRKHRASGQAFVELNKRRYYLGPHGSKTSLAEYDRLIAEWLAHGRQMPTEPEQTEIIVTQLCVEYRKLAQRYYVKNGETTSEVDATRARARIAAGELVSSHIIPRHFNTRTREDRFQYGKYRQVRSLFNSATTDQVFRRGASLLFPQVPTWSCKERTSPQRIDPETECLLAQMSISSRYGHFTKATPSIEKRKVRTW